MRGAWLTCVGVLALAGCNKPAETGAKAPAVAVAPAAPSGPPARKPGLWEQAVSASGMSQTMTFCLDAATDKEMKITGQQAAAGACSVDEVKRTAEGWTFRSECDNGPAGKSVTTGSATGDFDSHYRVTASSTTTGAEMAQANGTREVSIESVWKGACPADMKPGDMRLPNGMTMNIATIRDAQKANAAAKAGR